VHGSVNDYYQEISYGRFHVEGKVFDAVQVGKKRPEYAQTANKTALLSEAIDKLLERDGDHTLKNFDGIFFMYAGTRFHTQRGGLYWPHRASLSHKGQPLAYFICPRSRQKMESISRTAQQFRQLVRPAQP